MRRKFTLLLIPTLFVIALLGVLLFLGNWQFHRYKIKTSIQNDYKQKLHKTALSYKESLKKSNDTIQFQNIRIKGHFDYQHAIYLDNKTHEHHVGYHVLTPFVSSENLPSVLINRGWISRGKDRRQLPVIKPVKGVVAIKGQIILPSKKPFHLGKQENNLGGWPWRIQYIDLDQISKALNKNIAPFIIEIDKNSKYSFIIDSQVAYLTPERHLGYAVQWYSLALVLLIAYTAVCFRKEPLTDETV